MQVGGWVKTLPLLLYIAISNDVIKTYNDQLHLANLDLVGIPNFFSFQPQDIYEYDYMHGMYTGFPNKG